ncbi:Glutamate--cysteine ligase [Liberibacter crescens BT-1]|uniref:Glutamate--cysteine ligase n=1 Tax=Liberibacter crescens (strain BT-1) TaxID=1215343 RepID=L0ETW6_LIBCB|nr:glutamate--cysteine ligase [Liberibacter crescens]AGA64290.1 Glutamate--cysteine ligase [Liberibacter crescens BT-1]AMC12512.1 glutamate--cysteine ligase [Liberibacter crescens]
MNTDSLNQIIVTSIEDLIEYFCSGIKLEKELSIGVEHEKFIFTKSMHTPIPYIGERSILTLLQALKKNLGWETITDQGHLIGLYNPIDHAAISLEPGGQFELSGAPLNNLHETNLEIYGHITALKQITDPLDLGMIGMGSNPKWTLEETPRMPKSRYKIMAEYMPKVCKNGLDMMYRTCTAQVNLDFLSEADMAKKMLIAMKLQPLATALFAASPFTEGHPNGMKSWRSQIWRNTDSKRTGLLPFVFKPDFGFNDYIQWALDIPMYFVIRDENYHTCTDITFRQFMNGALKYRIKDWQPTLQDWSNHLSTLFPEVRLKQYIEMRGTDSGTPDKILAVSAFWVGLLYDSSALEAIDTLTSQWSFADINLLHISVPWQGLEATINKIPLSKIASQVVAIAKDGLKARAKRNSQNEDETTFLLPLEKMINSQMTLADEMLDAYYRLWGNSVEPCFESYAY